MVDIIRAPHVVKVRKPHICQGCGKKIEAGESVTSSTYGDGSTVWTFYECADCNHYRIKECFSCKDFEDCMGEDYHIGLIKECKSERSR